MEPQPTGESVSELLGKGGDTGMSALAQVYVPMIWAMAQDYTRGNGFNEDGTEAETALVSVVKIACVRLVANPTQVKRYQVGEYSETPSLFQGWTVGELAVLNTYRVRAR